MIILVLAGGHPLPRPGWKTCTNSLLHSDISAPLPSNVKLTCTSKFLWVLWWFSQVMFYSVCFIKNPIWYTFSSCTLFQKHETVFGLYCSLYSVSWDASKTTRKWCPLGEVCIEIWPAEREKGKQGGLGQSFQELFFIAMLFNSAIDVANALFSITRVSKRHENVVTLMSQSTTQLSITTCFHNFISYCIMLFGKEEMYWFLLSNNKISLLIQVNNLIVKHHSQIHLAILSNRVSSVANRLLLVLY